jgi:hypothetical protein
MFGVLEVVEHGHLRYLVSHGFGDGLGDSRWATYVGAHRLEAGEPAVWVVRVALGFNVKEGEVSMLVGGVEEAFGRHTL